MANQTARATGSDLATVVADAARDLLAADVRVRAELPDGIDLSDIEVTLSATVERRSDNGVAPRADEGTNVDDIDEAAEHDPSGDHAEDDADDAGDGSAVRDRSGSQDVDDAGASPDDADDDADDADGPSPLSDEELDDLDEEADAGADFVEGLLDAMDLPGELRIRVIEDTRRAEVEVVDMGSGALIGRRGSTLEAVQELMRCALQSQFERRVHVHVDVEGYRARRLEKLLDKADEAIDQVLDTGEPERLEPMDVFERKAIHEFVNTVDGVLSRSQGREPSRRIVLEPTD